MASIIDLIEKGTSVVETVRLKYDPFEVRVSPVPHIEIDMLKEDYMKAELLRLMPNLDVNTAKSKKARKEIEKKIEASMGSATGGLMAGLVMQKMLNRDKYKIVFLAMKPNYPELADFTIAQGEKLVGKIREIDDIYRVVADISGISQESMEDLTSFRDESDGEDGNDAVGDGEGEAEHGNDVGNDDTPEGIPV